MAANRSMETLPENDIEIDGECHVPTAQQFAFKPNLEKSMFNKNERNENRCDSGFVSISPHSSLESRSLKQEEKLSVQCSDNEDICELEKKLGGMRVVDEDDEGVSSFDELLHSLESVDSDTTDVLEVDLFEHDVDGDTLIHLAILSRATMLASVLIDIVEDKECLNIQNQLYQTPLHLSILTEQYENAIQLVAKGADVTRCDKQGNTALHLACKTGEKEVVKAILDSFGQDLLARKKYFAVKNCEGLTCLHVASQQKHFLLMGYLFAKGADVNMGDAKSGRTILHYAVENKDLETVVLLLTHPDIKVDCKTFKGETPLVMAYWRNYQDIVKKLKSKGAFFSYDLFEESDDDAS